MWYNMHMRNYRLLVAATLFLAILCGAPADSMPTSRTRYATDAYPGFDREENIVLPGKKEPRWFHFWNGPKYDTPEEEFAYAESCRADGWWRAARRAYDALVREWPTSPEAPKAQLALADLYLGHYQEYENAFEEYRYLLDYYSSACDYDAIARRLYEVAKMMREEGKTIIFFRFANTVDVRRAFEAVVFRAPGASYAPEAMLTVAELREEDGEYEKAVTVYENLRNLHAGTSEADDALYREGKARMIVLREHEYNRQRCQDTIDYLKMAMGGNVGGQARRDEMKAWLDEAQALVEEEAFAAAKFYDSRTRTKRSAINAYERFLKEYPASVHANEALSRLAELKSEEK